MNSISLNIKQWSAWMPDLYSASSWQQWARAEDSSVSELKDHSQLPSPAIPAMLSRRLSPLGKKVMSVIMPIMTRETAASVTPATASKYRQIPCVFCSRHGEADRTAVLLQSLAVAEPLSPTHFSLSVHNAIAGVFSMATDNQNNLTALASRESQIGEALFESWAILQASKSNELLCVIYDQVLPATSMGEGVGPTFPYVTAFLISSESHPSDCWQVTQAMDHCSNQASNALPDALQFLRFLLRDECEQLRLSNSRHDWVWQKSWPEQEARNV